MEEIKSEWNSEKQDYYIITCVVNSLLTCHLPLQLMLCTIVDTLIGDFLFCRSILSSATCSKIIAHKNPRWKRKKKKKKKKQERTRNFSIPSWPCAAKYLKFWRILVSEMNLAANISQAIPQALEEYASEL